MAHSIPYLGAPGSIRTALEKIAEAATPERVTTDFVQTVLGMKGGTGAAIIPFFKKIGMVASDGSPTELYKRYRNKSTGKAAIAEAIKIGYKKLSEVNEYFYKLGDPELKDLIIQVTGSEPDGAVVDMAYRTLKAMKGFADFDSKPAEQNPTAIAPATTVKHELPPTAKKDEALGLGLNLSYTINLNLPATSDQAVFNAIFRSLKEFLITDAKE
jgi:hypothetical protein